MMFTCYTCGYRNGGSMCTHCGARLTDKPVYRPAVWAAVFWVLGTWVVGIVGTIVFVLVVVALAGCHTAPTTAKISSMTGVELVVAHWSSDNGLMGEYNMEIVRALRARGAFGDETVQWYIDHPKVPHGELQHFWNGSFDYYNWEALGYANAIEVFEAMNGKIPGPGGTNIYTGSGVINVRRLGGGSIRVRRYGR